MVNKCALSYCSTGKESKKGNSVNEEKSQVTEEEALSEHPVIEDDGKQSRGISTFKFPLDKPDLLEKWVYFVGKSNWKPSTNSVICEKHFEKAYVKLGGKRNKLNYDMGPVPTIHTEESENIPKSVLRVPAVPRPTPLERNPTVDEKPAFKQMDKISSMNCLTQECCPAGFLYRKHRDKVVYYNMQFDYVTSIPQVFESIVVDEKLHVNLSYKGKHIPLPNFLRNNHCVLNKFSILENLPAYIRAKANESNSVLDELSDIKYFSPQGRPTYSASIIRWALLLRHTSPQAYRMLLEKLPLPSFNLLKKIQHGGLDAVKAIQRLLKQRAVSQDSVLLVDEMYLEKMEQYHSGKVTGADPDGELYKGIVAFMIVGIDKSIPYVVKSSPEVTITGEWLTKQIDECISTVAKAGFNVRAVIADDHSTNTSAYSKLHNKYDGDSQTYIKHPAYGGNMKTYLFFDMVHLIKNVRNNLLNKKKFVFPKFSFDLFEDKIEVGDGYVDWSLLHKVREKDEDLQANLKKAPKLTSQVLHPGNKKQNVGLALSIFHETTPAAIKSYFPDRKEAAEFLNLFHKLFLILNSKQRYNTADRLGHAAVPGDNKPEFLRSVANWVEEWSQCPHFTLTPQTSHALVTTLRSSASLIEDLLGEGFHYVLTARFQSDPLELHFSKYRQMSGGRFLVSLCEVQHSERILAIDKLLKEDINFWEEDLQPDDTAECFIMDEIEEEVRSKSSEIRDCELSDQSKEVSFSIAGGVAKKLSQKSKCPACTKHMVSTVSNVEHSSYLNLVSRGGLTTPTPTLSKFVNRLFSILDCISPILLKYSSTLSVRPAAETIVGELVEQIQFTCDTHVSWGRKWAIRTIVNIFFNNHQKISNERKRKNQVADLKKTKRTKES